MYKFFEDTTKNTVGLRLSGDISGKDLREIFDAIDKKIRIQQNSRLLLEFDDFNGWPLEGLFTLTGFFLKHRGDVDRLALVGSNESIERIEQALPVVAGMEIEHFDNTDAARRWLDENDDHWAVDPSKYAAQTRYPKDMRILIVGAGVAGLTLAAMLQQKGIQPDIVEDAPEFGHLGYVIILMQAGSRILKGLGVHQDLYEHGVAVSNYDIADTDGNVLRSHTVGDSYASVFGDSFSIYRPALIDVIRGAVDESAIQMGTTVDHIEQTNDEVMVTLSDGSQKTYDLVIGADGAHSKMRDLVFGDVEMIYSGLHGWAWWGEQHDAFTDRVLEHWGTGGAFGLYPTADRLCVVGVVKTEAGQPDDPETRKQRIREHYKDWSSKWVHHGLDELDDMKSEDLFHDDFYYGAQQHWYRGRVVLAGDSVHAFSPISGLGASMAMESAATLAEELSYVDSRFIDQALRKYEDRHKQRVFLLRNQARTFGGIVTTEQPAFAGLRNLAVRYIEQGPVHKLLARIPYEPV